MIFEKQYKNTAPWQFNKREAIDVNSQIFWQSDYGQMVDRTLHTLVSDIDKNMVCQPTQARIVKVAGNKITFNLGLNRRNHIKGICIDSMFPPNL